MRPFFSTKIESSNFTLCNMKKIHWWDSSVPVGKDNSFNFFRLNKFTMWSVKYGSVLFGLMLLLSFGEAFGQLTQSAQPASVSACPSGSTSLAFKVGKGTGCV